MGWASGQGILEEVFNYIRDYVPKKYKREVLQGLVKVFEDNDGDTCHEVLDAYDDYNNKDTYDKTEITSEVTDED